MAPRHGVRFTLKLSSQGPEVVYGFAAEAPGRHHEGRVRVVLDSGRVTFEDCDDLPANVAGAMRALLRSLWRPRQSEELPWPRRLQRWRDLDAAPGG